MSMFNTYWKCNYDELITFYPRFYREVFEMDAILRAEGKLADGIQSGIDKMLMNNFVDSADEDVISVYEQILGITSDSSKSIEERRRLVKARLIGSGKISASLICSMIEAYTGEKAECRLEAFDDDDNNMLYIDVERTSSSQIVLQEIESMLSEKLPAHIEYELSFVFNQPLILSFEREYYAGDIPRCGEFLCGQLPFQGVC